MNKTSFIFAALLGLSLISLSQSILIPHPKAVGRELPRYKIDMDGDFKKEWTPLLTDFKDDIKKVVSTVETFIPIPKFLFKLVGDWGKNFFKYQNYTQQIELIADVAEVDFRQLFTLNLLYEFLAFKACTSAVIRNADNRIFHLRNWDFEFMRALANTTYEVEMQRNNETVYVAQGIAPAIFQLSAVKYGKFAITINARHNGTFFENIKDMFVRNYKPATHLIRDVMESADTYDQAVEMLSNTKTIDPIYFIVSGVGKNEGTVIEKDREIVHKQYSLDEDTWFLVQTNYDREDEDPAKDRRRYPAEEKIWALGQQVGEQEVYEHVFINWPNFNIGTIVTSSMSATSNYFNSTKWW